MLPDSFLLNKEMGDYSSTCCKIWILTASNESWTQRRPEHSVKIFQPQTHFPSKFRCDNFADIFSYKWYEYYPEEYNPPRNDITNTVIYIKVLDFSEETKVASENTQCLTAAANLSKAIKKTFENLTPLWYCNSIVTLEVIKNFNCVITFAFL